MVSIGGGGLSSRCEVVADELMVERCSKSPEMMARVGGGLS